MSDASLQASADKTLQNRRRAERRRQVSRTVHDVRAQLSSFSGVTPDFDFELLSSHARARLDAIRLMPLVGLVAAGLAMHWSGTPETVVWLVLALLTQSIPYLLARRFLNVERPHVALNRWRRRFVLADFVAALAWSLVFSLAVTAQGLSPIYPASVFLVLVTAVAIPATNQPLALLAATLPVTLSALSAMVLNWSTDPAHSGEVQVLAALMVAVQIFFIALGHRFMRATLAEVRARSEKDSLIAELEQANAISDESRRKAEEANLAKSRFLAAMSHELRTPLNAILGFSEVMQTELLGPVGNPTYRGYVADINDSGRHLLNLINEILDLSRIEAGRQTLSEEAVTLAHVAEDCIHMMTLRARNKGLTIQENYEENLPRIWADERAIRQIILNLLSNAMKFTPAGGTITLTVGWTAGGGQFVSVRDTGPGIAESEIPIVLSAFGQGSIAIKSSEQGTGLGLNIVQALVQMHGGTFDLKSKLREGTEVTFTIPMSRVLDAVQAVDDGKRRRASMGMPVATVAMLEALRNQARSA